MKRSVLILQPIHNTSADIFKRFHLGQPLSSEQFHLLDSHRQQLSSRDFDPILEYYLHAQEKKHLSFILPYEKINREAIKSLKKRLRLMLQKNSAQQAAISFTPEQFAKFKQYTMQELIFWHGNQSLTGAPSYPSCIPPIIYFQWGNQFGIVKQSVLAGEKALKANILVYFEDRQERNLENCVADYKKHLAEQIKVSGKVIQNKKEIVHSNQPSYPAAAVTLEKSHLTHPPTKEIANTDKPSSSAAEVTLEKSHLIYPPAPSFHH
jgi:hypothetical protein